MKIIDEIKITKEAKHYPKEENLKVVVDVNVSALFQFDGSDYDTTTYKAIEIELTNEEKEILSKLWDRLEKSYKQI